MHCHLLLLIRPTWYLLELELALAPSEDDEACELLDDAARAAFAAALT